MSPKYEIDILVVDDDEGHVELVRRNLHQNGITNKIVPLNSGQAGLDYVFCRGAYQGRQGNGNLLILLDIHMPGSIDGVEVLRQLKADPEKKKIPVIMLTTTDDPREVDRCYKLGCNVYVTKPVDPARFIEAIRRLGLFISVVNIPSEEKSAP
jgi:CheY-like chemotaxis protein